MMCPGRNAAQVVEEALVCAGRLLSVSLQRSHLLSPTLTYSHLSSQLSLVYCLITDMWLACETTAVAINVVV